MSIRDTLRDLDLRPSRALGQNFLVDSDQARWIVDQIEPATGDTVVEVGAGTGALTRHLAGRVERLILIEFDSRLAAYLRQEFAGQAEVIEGDAVKFDMRPLWKHGPIKLLGNLPYSAGGEIMRNFLTIPTPVAKAVLMVQHEVAERLCAKPRTKSYGLLTLRIQSGWRTKLLRTIKPEAFVPRPQIDSTVVCFERRSDEDLGCFDRRLFDRLARQGFAQRRKKLRKRLDLNGKDWDACAAAAEISPDARAEELSLQDWIRLSRIADAHPLKDHPQSGDELFDVVNEANTVIDQQPRAKVHAEKLRHRAVHLFVFNKHGELFLQKRSHLKDACAELWDSSAAGHLDAGEEYDACAARELEEELGVTAPVEAIGEITATEKTGWEFVRLFKAEHNGPFHFPASEISAGMFLPIDEIKAWIEAHPEDFAPGFLECFKLRP